jgi:hypothetical protein
MGAINEVIVRTVENGYILWWYEDHQAKELVFTSPFQVAGRIEGLLLGQREHAGSAKEHKESGGLLDRERI